MSDPSSARQNATLQADAYGPKIDLTDDLTV